MRKVVWEKSAITVLRCAIGWHFLYEGLSKIWAEHWTATGFLANARGPFAGFYHGLASSEPLTAIIDPMNVYGLTLIGLGLFVGLATNYAAVAGIVLLTLYYCAYPPFGAAMPGYTEGSLFLVNRNVIEALALLALLLIREKGYGLHHLKLLPARRARAKADGEAPRSRREALKDLTTLPALGLLGGCAVHDHRKYRVDALSGATIQVGGADISELRGELPQGKIGKHSISRLVLGGNLIGGWAHSRDLIYVPSLFRAYNTEQKVFETLILAEKTGINAINIGFPSNALLRKYKDITGSKIQVISQVAPDMGANDYFVNINQAIDFGVDIIQVQGNWCDWMVRDNRMDVIDAMLDYIRAQGYVAGLASHTVDSLIACEEQGIIPDYYMKTMHHDRYWSAHPMANRKPFEVDGERSPDHNHFHDNLFCLFPERTVEFVQHAKVPVMGYKVLAAGAIMPQDGFHWAFENGADFICVGMFDFQVVNDVNVTIDVLKDTQTRQRPWYG